MEVYQHYNSMAKPTDVFHINCLVFANSVIYSWMLKPTKGVFGTRKSLPNPGQANEVQK
jgi:hypothetical protein